MPDQKQVIEALLKPQTYPQNPGKIELIQTHISLVFLTENYVYKVKKAVNFGFLDFSNSRKTAILLRKRTRSQQALCPEIYLEVLPINPIRNNPNRRQRRNR